MTGHIMSITPLDVLMNDDKFKVNEMVQFCDGYNQRFSIFAVMQPSEMNTLEFRLDGTKKWGK